MMNQLRNSRSTSSSNLTLRAASSRLTTLAALLCAGALCGGCVDGEPAALAVSEAAVSRNLVSTSYYSCSTGEWVGEKTSGCVIGTPATTGQVTSCYSVESEPCDTVDYYNYIDFCVGSVCDRFPYPIDPGPYSQWLANQ